MTSSYFPTIGIDILSEIPNLNEIINVYLLSYQVDLNPIKRIIDKTLIISHIIISVEFDPINTEQII